MQELHLNQGKSSQAYIYMFVAYNMQIFGALWYLLAVERKDACWADACRHSEECNGKFSLLYCMHERAEADMTAWRNITHEVLEKNCAATDDSPFNYGIYAKAVSSGVVDSEDFITKYCYCLWWGLQNLRQAILHTYLLGKKCQCNKKNCSIDLIYFSLWMN